MHNVRFPLCKEVREKDKPGFAPCHFQGGRKGRTNARGKKGENECLQPDHLLPRNV